MPTRTTCQVVLAGVLGVVPPPTSGEEATVRPVDAAALASVLLTEDDRVGLTAYGSVPMSAEHPDEYYSEPSTELCEEDVVVELLGPDDLYAYMGDGGDYVFMDEWVSVESMTDATERFRLGTAAFDVCVDQGVFTEIESVHPDLDEYRVYAPAGGADSGDDTSLTITYVRHGGVLLLHVLQVLNPERFGAEQGDHLIEVALDKLIDFGRAEVPAEASSTR